MVPNFLQIKYRYLFIESIRLSTNCANTFFFTHKSLKVIYGVENFYFPIRKVRNDKSYIQLVLSRLTK